MDVQARDWRVLQESVAQKAHVFWKENNERFLKGKAAYEAGACVLVNTS